ncbi:MAG: hypothetical protein F6J92_21585 [Symploca sp. SIO1A3]|nr:hypothetical protein [Symploca sp. SIO1A3]
MTLTIIRANLSSRVKRSEIGPRTYDVYGQIQEPESDGFIQKIISVIGKVVGFLFKKVWQLLVAGFRFSWSALWGGIVSTTQFLWRFNWNISEKEIQNQMKNSLTQLAGTLGGTLGNSLGWLVCGALPGTLIFSFNEALGLYVLENVGEEALEELASNIAQLVRLSFGLAARGAFYYLFIKARKAFYGDKPRSKKPWSFASSVEERVENIDNQIVEQFVEEFLEEFSESCIEAGYVVANTLDAWNAQQKMAQKSLLGPERTVEVQFTRDEE